MHFSAVCNYTFNDTFLPTGEATFLHSAWIQSSWPDAASPCRQHFQILYSGSIFQQLTDCGRFVPASGAKQPMRLNAWIAFPPYSKDAYFLLKIHTNKQCSAGWNSPAVAPWLAMKKWLIVAERRSNIYYLFTFRVIPSGSRQSTNKRSSCGTAVQNRTWIIDSETWEALAGLRALNKYRQAFLSLSPCYWRCCSKQHTQCHICPLRPANEDCPCF